MHFVKYIEIHFSTKRAPMVVAGAELQDELEKTLAGDRNVR